MPLVLETATEFAQRHGAYFQTRPPSGFAGGVAFFFANGAFAHIPQRGVLSGVKEPPDDPRELALARLRYYEPKLAAATKKRDEIVRFVKEQSNFHRLGSGPSASELAPNWKTDLANLTAEVTEFEDVVETLRDIAGPTRATREAAYFAERSRRLAETADEDIRELARVGQRVETPQGEEYEEIEVDEDDEQVDA